MGQNNQKDQKGPKMRAAVMLVQNNQNNQKIWSPHNSESAFFLGHPVVCINLVQTMAPGWRQIVSEVALDLITIPGVSALG